MPSDLENEIANLNKEVNRAKANIARMKRVTVGLQKRNQGKLADAKKALELLESQPQSSLRDAKIYFAKLNVEGARNALELVEVLEPLLVPDLKNAGKAMKANLARIDHLGAQARFIGIERQVVSFKDKLQLVQAALTPEAPPAEATAADATKPPTAPLRIPPTPGASPTGAPGPVVPGARPGLGARPGIPGQGAPGAARPGGPGPLAQRAALMQQNRAPVPGRTGPLTPSGAKPGTGPLAQRAAARSPQDNIAAEREAAILQIRTAAAGNPQTATALQTVVSMFLEIDTLLEPLRQGPEVGKIDWPAQQAEALLNNVAGKIYYLKRTIQGLGALAPLLAYDETKPGEDMALDAYLEKLDSEGDAGDAAAPAIEAEPKPARAGSVIDQLRSIMKSSK